MKSPFPGMDPYLEHHALWPDVHNRLITALADTLSPAVAPIYYVGVESRAYIIKPEGDLFLGRPDLSIVSPVAVLPTAVTSPIATTDVAVLEVSIPIDDEINHYYLEIRSVQTHELITVIELLSPVNKVNPPDRTEYIQKRQEILTSLTNLVEIDLLRSGDPMPVAPYIASDYRILVSRGYIPRKAHLYAFGLRAPIPDFPLPLRPDDQEPTVPLNQVLHQLYGRARFDLRLDYSQPPLPPLSDEDSIWAQELLTT